MARTLQSFPKSTHPSARVSRVVVIEQNPMHGDDVIVEASDGEKFVRVISFNSLSNDYAYTAAKDYAHGIANPRSETK